MINERENLYINRLGKVVYRGINVTHGVSPSLGTFYTKPDRDPHVESPWGMIEGWCGSAPNAYNGRWMTSGLHRSLAYIVSTGRLGFVV